MNTKKVLIIHPDVIVRRAFSQVLQEGTDCLVFASDEISNPEDLIKHILPDIVFMNIRGSETDNLAPFTTVHEAYPELPIVIISERMEKSAETAIAALFAGAVDFITKPEHRNSVLFAERHLYKRLLPMVQSILDQTSGNPETNIGDDTQSSFYKPVEQEEQSLDSLWPLSLVTIGGCMGGPIALQRFVTQLPKQFPVPILIVQHLPRIFTKVLAKKLDSLTPLEVQEARHGVNLEPGSIWITPGGYHSEIGRIGSELLLKIHRGPRKYGLRPSIDITFQSAGQVLGGGVLGVILSGYGTDGVAGANTIQEAGGQIIAQAPDTALAKEMPQSVINAGLCDAIFPVDEMVKHILLRTQNNSFPPKREQQERTHAIPKANFRNSGRSFFSRLH